MKVLISNDDGIDSPFLKTLAEVFSKNHHVLVAAPANEQSWIGKAMSRRGSVVADEIAGFPCPAFALSGTPSDCVNIALEHLCESKPQIIVSGINIGHNAGLSFIASSGTIGAALEGAFQKIPAIAASMYLESDQFEIMGKKELPLSAEMRAHVAQAAGILESLATELLDTQTPAYGKVHSLNFPCRNIERARIIKASAARTLSGPLFVKDGNRYKFSYKPLETIPQDQMTDREVIHKGDISHTIIDFTLLDNNTY